jgi:hypothetical protein
MTTQTVRDKGTDHSRKRLRELISGLYDPEMQERFASARALGAFAKENSTLVKQVWNRIFYAFDDTMSCWGVAEGLGEIARNLPEMRGKILALLRKFQNDEASCQGFIWAVCRIGQEDRELVKAFIPDLISRLDGYSACMIGQSIWALGELGISGAAGNIHSFLHDPRETWIYENDGVTKKSLGQISAEALQKLPPK